LYPQPEFCFAIFRIKVSSSGVTLGRPGYVRYFEPSNLLAISLRYHVRMLSGLATWATYAKALRPRRLPISASVDRSGVAR
jgi:hypothetical protein